MKVRVGSLAIARYSVSIDKDNLRIIEAMPWVNFIQTDGWSIESLAKHTGHRIKTIRLSKLMSTTPYVTKKRIKFGDNHVRIATATQTTITFPNTTVRSDSNILKVVAEALVEAGFDEGRDVFIANMVTVKGKDTYHWHKVALMADSGETRKLILTHVNGVLVSDLHANIKAKLLAMVGDIARQDTCSIKTTNDSTVKCGGYKS